MIMIKEESKDIEQKDMPIELLSPENKKQILEDFNIRLKNINISQISIEGMSSFMRDKILKHHIAILLDLLSLISDEAQRNPRIENLYVLNDVIQKIRYDERYTKISNECLKTIFPYLKDICICTYTIFDEKLKNEINNLIDIWKARQIYPDECLNEIKFEIKMNHEPEINGTNEEIKLLVNYVNSGSMKIDQSLIDFNNEMEVLERNGDNVHRKNLLVKYKDLIDKQLKLYNNQLLQLKDINTMLDAINDFELLGNNEVGNKIIGSQIYKRKNE